MTPETLYQVDGVIATYSGEAYNFLDPDPGKIHLTDIAQSLSQICRFAGHTSSFCPVAEHCVLVSEILEAEGHPRWVVKSGLMHDAHEAFMWDCPRPLKPLLGPEFERLADLCDIAIAKRFEMSQQWFHDPLVKAADDLALVNEGAQLMSKFGPDYWSSRWRPLPPGVPFHSGMMPSAAKHAFLQRAKELCVA